MALARLEAKVDLALSQLTGKVEDQGRSIVALQSTVAEMDKRTSSLETWRTWVLGACAVLGAIATFVVAFILARGQIDLKV